MSESVDLPEDLGPEGLLEDTNPREVNLLLLKGNIGRHQLPIMHSLPEESPPDLLKHFLPKQFLEILEIYPVLTEEPGYQGVISVDL